MSKEKIDIEALLVKAYREWRIDRYNPGSTARHMPAARVSPSEAVRRIGELGTLVQTSGLMETPITAIVPDGYTDMIAVHDAVLRLNDFYAEFQSETRLRLWTSEDAGMEDGRIDAVGTGAHREFSLRLPNRAPRSVRPLTAATLIIAHARSATQPDCFLDWRPRRGPRAMNTIDACGRPRLNIGVDAREVALARASYQVWWTSLASLVTDLANVLADFEVAGPIADPTPWMVEKAA